MQINNNHELEITKQQIARLESALKKMRLEESPEMYAMMSEAWLEQIKKMRDEIEEFVRHQLSLAHVASGSDGDG